MEFGGPLLHVRDPALKHGTLRTQPPPPGTKIAPRARVWALSKHVTTTALVHRSYALSSSISSLLTAVLLFVGWWWGGAALFRLGEAEVKFI